MATTPIETQELEKQSTSLTVQASQFQAIATTQDYTDAIGLGRALKAMEDGIDQFWGPLVAEAHKHHKTLVNRRDTMKSPVQIAIARLKGLISAYDQEQERIRHQKELEAQEALRKQQESDAIREAEALQASGDAEGAEAVISQAAAGPAPAVVIPSMVPKVAGKSSRTIWRWRLKDKGKLRPEYLMADEITISQVVRALKKSAEKAVGEGAIEVYDEASVSLR